MMCKILISPLFHFYPFVVGSNIHLLQKRDIVMHNTALVFGLTLFLPRNIFVCVHSVPALNPTMLFDNSYSNKQCCSHFLAKNSQKSPGCYASWSLSSCFLFNIRTYMFDTWHCNDFLVGINGPFAINFFIRLNELEEWWIPFGKVSLMGRVLEGYLRAQTYASQQQN